MQQLSDHLFRFEDTCNVYAVRSGRSAVLIDFGGGAVLDHLDEIGVERIAAVLMTHHHRDQAQGLPRAVAAGIPIYVPHMEQDLFHSIDAHWQAREIYNNYNSRQDRFSLLESVPVNGTLRDYETREFGGVRFTVVPTPGHTIGSISLWLERDRQRIAFTGDLIAAPGKVWSMSATQWTYNGAEGVAASVLSLLDLKDRQPDLLLPSHGDPIRDPIPALDLLADRFWQLLQLRQQYRRMLEYREKPYVEITPHLLRNRFCVANTYVLLSDSGRALIIDYGYDFATGFPLAGSDRAGRRPWLYSLPMLKQQFGVSKIDVVLPTHFHDDHVAGINLLREVEGAQVWAAEMFADVLEQPARFDLPCLWYDPIPVDRRLPLEMPFQWEEYTLTLHPLPGHTLYAVAISFEVDGKRVLAAGDQYQSDAGLELNYVYPNLFEAADYVKSAELYKRLAPDLILTGHWLPFTVPPGYFDQLAVVGGELERLHNELLLQDPCLGTSGFLARIEPYQAVARDGEPVVFHVQIHNPFPRPADAELALVTPHGWQVAEGMIHLRLAAAETQRITFTVSPPPDFHGWRARVAVDATIDGHAFGQQAEALVSAAR